MVNHNAYDRIRQVFPWLLWQIWKARNSLVFNKLHVNPHNMVAKAYEEAELWQQAQSVEVRATSKWCKPSQGSIKCNVGSSWNKSGHPSGAAWILRDHNGSTIMHSRRAYFALRSKEEADLYSLLWAVESMRDLRKHHVSFESSSTEMRDILLNPQNFHHFHHLVSAITPLRGWSVHHANLECNSVAGAIATSVTTGRRYQSYVASNGPAWLHSLLSAEAIS
ncbi:hypothetical protein HID58_014117 [Brassica napus]|uniref:RNase H type-1 domain-containing protein n=1 Tax=Brassica napus TaxID=3708 RepID=A0ABQ8DIW1_BRANA|nr:hypothetical protein HID58_014117 [Brassica napus]